ncbi:MAG: DUF2634 domain-containing protein [Peptoniphilus sp.]|nr:DUF2634 domain-containing protein [Peptoniphilus sp.]MDY6045248.1 DUF2634 domain-containing protein [Peptoniphilus sp.]
MPDYFPFIEPDTAEERTVPVCSEYAYDFETQNFKLNDDGGFYLVYEIEALKIKLWKLFMTVRWQYDIFPPGYGNELESLIGRAYTQGYINSEAERFVREAVDRNLSDYIKRLEDLTVDFDDGTLYISFKVISIYGDFTIDRLGVTL